MKSSVSISNTASNMLSSLYPRNPGKVNEAIAAIEADVRDSAKAQKLTGYDDVFVSRGHGMRIVFRRSGNSSVVTSIAAEA